MRLAFLGNGPFAVPSLRRLAQAGHDVAIVVARPDLPQGKHQQLVDGPVKAASNALGLTVEQPADANSNDFIARLVALKLDLLVVADFGQILSSDCLAAARLGGINVHASLLPAYRGAAPIAWAILRGEARSGVSIIQMSPRLDAGAVILQQPIAIARQWTAGDLELRLADIGAELVAIAVGQIANGLARPMPQDDRQSSRAPKLKKDDGKIDWSRGAVEIFDLIRAMQPWPIAFSTLERPAAPPVRMQILQAEDPLSATTTEFSLDHALAKKQLPGHVCDVGRTLDVLTGNGMLHILRVKPAGKSEMDIASFVRGNPIPAGSRFT